MKELYIEGLSGPRSPLRVATSADGKVISEFAQNMRAEIAGRPGFPGTVTEYPNRTMTEYHNPNGLFGPGSPTHLRWKLDPMVA